MRDWRVLWAVGVAFVGSEGRGEGREDRRARRRRETEVSRRSEEDGGGGGKWYLGGSCLVSGPCSEVTEVDWTKKGPVSSLLIRLCHGK